MEKNKKLINVIIVFILVIFILMWILVKFNIANNIDFVIKQLVENLRTDNLNTLFIIITNLGSTIPVMAIMSGMLIYLLLKKNNNNKQTSSVKDIILIITAMVVSSSLFCGIKQIQQRDRPEILDCVVEQGGYSFPSGHATIAMTTYLTLMILFAKYIKNIKVKRIINSICFFMIISIGFSRIYLGVHYLSDVIAGFSLGILSTLVSYKIIYQAHRRVKDGANKK